MSIVRGANMRGANLLGRFIAMPNEFASLGMDLDFLNLASMTLDVSNNIQAILDATSQDRDFTQPTASLRPAFIAGVGAQFVDDHLEHSANLITDNTGTVMAVVRFDRANSAETFLSQGNNAIADGDSLVFNKRNSANGNRIAKELAAIGTSSMSGELAITDTTNFRVITIQKSAIYINSMQQDLILSPNSPLARWFDNTISLGANRMFIGALVRSAPITYARVTLKRVSYFNSELNNQDVIRLVNGLRLYYNF
ncbi:MAG: hypothetical protein ACK5OS_02645 [Chryseotalea sp.]|jgi:hypothetical protein